MYLKTIRRHSYWKERDPYHTGALFIGYARGVDNGEWLGFIGAI